MVAVGGRDKERLAKVQFSLPIIPDFLVHSRATMENDNDNIPQMQTTQEKRGLNIFVCLFFRINDNKCLKCPG